MEEEKVVLGKIKEIEDEWKESRPHQSNVSPSRALDLLAIIGKKITQTK